MLPIQKMISSYNHYKYNNPQYIVIHYVGAQSSTAKNNAVYFFNGDRQASAHYFVDNNEIWQSVEDKCGSWAVGNTRTEVNNQNSINIEMCCMGDNLLVTEKTEENTVELVKYLMSKYNIPIANVRTHYEVSGKTKVCPNWSSNNWDRWIKFKNKLVVSKNNEVVKERKYDMKNLVCYCNQVDKRIAEYLADYLGCPCMDATISFNYDGVAENIYAVGGDNPNKGKNGQFGFSGYTTKYIAGNDRYNTIKEVLKFMGKL